MASTTTIGNVKPVQQQHRPQQHIDNSDNPPGHQETRRRKQEFLRRAGDDYGYQSSPAGYIDTWRKQEFPGLIGPVPLPSEQLSAGNATNNDDATNNSNNDHCNDDDEVYLDYAGSALPSRSLLQAIHEDSISAASILGNPHSSGPAASRTLRRIEESKKVVLDHFRGHPGRLAAVANSTAAPNDKNNNIKSKDHLFHPGYDIVFTSGTTDALRIVAEHFPWSATGQSGTRTSLLVYPHNAHTSVVGMRGPVLAKGGNFVCKPLEDIMKLADDSIDNNEKLEEILTHWGDELACSNTVRDRGEKEESRITDPSRCVTRHLLALSAECNFGGDRPDVAKLMRKVRRLGEDQLTSSSIGGTSGRAGTWSTLLDLAKAACTGPINLKELDPDFACISLYKMVGVPTGLGVLFVRRTAAKLLLSPQPSSLHRYFGGGSVDVVLSGKDFAIGRNLGQSSSSTSADVARQSSLASLTHGTMNFRAILALPHAFRELDRVGGMEQIQRHTYVLGRELVRRLKSLQHGNQRRVVDIFGAWGQPILVDGMKEPGPVVAFNIRQQCGTIVGYNEVEKLAAFNQPPLQLRTGCFCNPGACQHALKMSDDQIMGNFMTSGHVCGDSVDTVNGMPTGLCRISLGKDSIFEDVDALVIFIERHFCMAGEQAKTRSKNCATTIPRGPTMAVVSELFIYPIKSCACQQVKSWNLDLPSGRFQYDREFALVDSFGTALRLQKFPKMGFIQPRLDLEQGNLTVSAPDMPDLVLSLSLNQDQDDDGTTTITRAMELQSLVSVCGNKCRGKLWGDLDASEWFSFYLGIPCWLARYDGGGFYARSNDSREHPLSTTDTNDNISHNQHAFSNEKPLLLISQHAVDQLNSILHCQKQPSVSAKHFRPNLVVTCRSNQSDADGELYHPEDSWEELTLVNNRASTSTRDGGVDKAQSMKQETTDGTIQLSVCGLCSRCAMVDVDPTTGSTKGKTLRALADYRRNGGDIHFGIFLQGSSSTSSSSPSSSSASVEDISSSGSGPTKSVWLGEGSELLCR